MFRNNNNTSFETLVNQALGDHRVTSEVDKVKAEFKTRLSDLQEEYDRQVRVLKRTCGNIQTRNYELNRLNAHMQRKIDNLRDQFDKRMRKAQELDNNRTRSIHNRCFNVNGFLDANPNSACVILFDEGNGAARDIYDKFTNTVCWERGGHGEHYHGGHWLTDW